MSLLIPGSSKLAGMIFQIFLLDHQGRSPKYPLIRSCCARLFQRSGLNYISMLIFSGGIIQMRVELAGTLNLQAIHNHLSGHLNCFENSSLTNQDLHFTKLQHFAPSLVQTYLVFTLFVFMAFASSWVKVFHGVHCKRVIKRSRDVDLEIASWQLFIYGSKASHQSFWKCDMLWHLPTLIMWKSAPALFYQIMLWDDWCTQNRPESHRPWVGSFGYSWQDFVH